MRRDPGRATGRLVTAALVAFALGAPSAPAAAADFVGTASTVGIGREAPRGHDSVTDDSLYEILALEVGELGLPGFDHARLVGRGWGRLQLGDDETLTGNSADLQLLYLEGRAGPVTLRLGRQHVPQGFARMELLDGADVKVYLPAGLSVQGYFGAVVPREFDYESGTWQGGGRLAYHFGAPGEIGVSYRHRRHDGELSHEEVGVDGYALLGPVHLSLRAAYAPRDERFVEEYLAVGVYPVDEVRVTVDYERVAPDLLLGRDSIFSVFADAPHDAIGGDVAWSPQRYYTFSGEAHALLLDGDSLGYRGTLRAIAYREANHRSYVGLEGRRVDETTNSFYRGRAFTALQLLDPLRVAADAYAYSYDVKIRGTRNSYLGTLSLLWDIRPDMQLTGTAGLAHTPSAEVQFEGLLRFTYGYGLDLAREVGP